MEKNYEAELIEDGLYNDWEKSGKMVADAKSKKKPFTIPLPPPNVTGQLHLGHAAMLAIEDILIRYKKMTGHEVLWITGTDHAAIATENVVLKKLGAKSREEYSREDFLGHCRDFAEEKHDTIINQMKKMGGWMDWSREVYTFDKPRNVAVNEMFKNLYNDGLIVRGYRLINWSTGAQSVISDDELEYEEIKEVFYYIKCGEFIVGTVRPETKCADSPLIVNPDAEYLRIKVSSKSCDNLDENTDNSVEIIDTIILVKNCFENLEERAKVLSLYGEDAKFEILEKFTGKELEAKDKGFEYDTYAGKRNFYILADAVVDPNKGSGAMTISCNHSADDYDLGKRKKLDKYFFDKIGLDGKMKAVAGSCEGLSVLEARKKSGKLMQEMNLLTGIDKNYQHRVPLCYRSGSVIEPMVSPQWFISVDKEFKDEFTGEITTLKRQMQAAVRENYVKIIPEKFNKTYFQWIDNLQDWCISRQIWWGHQIPVWYDDQDKIVAVGNLTAEQELLNLRRDEDTLDTWFSSALWPMSPLGWPNVESDDFKKFFPSDVLETGHDILFFWVARMIMFGRYATGKYPYHTVYLHGMVCDEKGKKMSKSKGNGIDPLDMIAKFGADPVRLSMVIGSTPGQNIPIGEAKISGYRNFVNKLWNAGRFVEMQFEENTKFGEISAEKPNLENISLADKWILSRLSAIINTVKKSLENYQISNAGDVIYHFVWNEFCAWYIEASKVELNKEVLRFVYLEILKLVHPLCPFVTESLWKNLGDKNNLLVENEFPNLDFENGKSAEIFATIQQIVTEIRSVRAEKKLNPKDKISIKIKAVKNLADIKSATDILKTLAILSEVEISEKIEKPDHSVLKIVGDLEIYIEIPFDAEVEKVRLTKEQEHLEKNIGGLRGRLNNKSYLEKAPEALVNQTKDSLDQAELALVKIKEALAEL